MIETNQIAAHHDDADTDDEYHWIYHTKIDLLFNNQWILFVIKQESLCKYVSLWK